MDVVWRCRVWEGVSFSIIVIVLLVVGSVTGTLVRAAWTEVFTERSSSSRAPSEGLYQIPYWNRGGRTGGKIGERHCWLFSVYFTASVV